MRKAYPTPRSASSTLNQIAGIPALPDPMAALRRTTMPTAPKGTPDLTVLEVFAGAGLLGSGLVAGAVAAGYQPRHLAYCEHDDVPASVYAANFGHDIPRVRDIRSVADGFLGAPPTVAERAFAALVMARSGRLTDPIDVLCGGPPCQDFSVVRAHRPAAGNGRCALYLRMVRLAEVLRPRMVIVENVAAAVRHKSGIVQSAIAHLESIGYRVAGKIMDAMNLGVAQHRARFLLVAVRADVASAAFSFTDLAASYGTRHYGVAEAIGDLRDIPGDPEREGGSKTGIMQARIQWLADHPGQPLPLHGAPDQAWQTQHPDLELAVRAKCHNKKIYGQAYQRMVADQPAPTLTRFFWQMANGRFTHYRDPRTMSPREGLRCQGVADWFVLPPADVLMAGNRRKNVRTELYRVIANGAPAPLGERLLLAAIQQGCLLPGGIRAKAVSAA